MALNFGILFSLIYGVLHEVKDNLRNLSFTIDNQLYLILALPN